MRPDESFDRSLYRLIFALAAVYNFIFGLWAGFRPASFFNLFGLEPPRYPAIWACLGMVVGVYGLAYACAAWRLERAAPFIAIGLVGKVLGPIGWVITVNSGEWPVRTVTLILFNDVVWWVPFGLFLLDGTGVARRVRAATPWICAAVHIAAGAAMLAWLWPGTEVIDSIVLRTEYIAQHALAWRSGWALWVAAALSLLGLYAWWGARIPSRRIGLAAFCIAVVGLGCDLLGESLYIGWLPGLIATVSPLATLLTGAAANGLYTLAGVVLTLGTPHLRGRFLVWTWAIWIAGAALTACTLAGSPQGMAMATAILFILLIPWSVRLGANLR